MHRRHAMFSTSTATRSTRLGGFAAWMALGLALGGCGSDGGVGPSADPMSLVAEQVRTESAPIPPNPTTGDETPEALQRGVVYRYRLQAGRPVRAVIVLVPGIASGADDFDYLARELIRRSDGAVEVWAFERRPNLLEDLTGMQEAERVADPDVALGYYFRGEPVNGRTFPGFLGQADVPFLSEWGIGVVMRDIQAAIDLVPGERRRTNVVLVGHSLGVVQVLDFLGWDFDGDATTLGDAGYEQVAASVLIDAPIFASPPASPVTSTPLRWSASATGATRATTACCRCSTRRRSPSPRSSACSRTRASTTRTIRPTVRRPSCSGTHCPRPPRSKRSST